MYEDYYSNIGDTDAFLRRICLDPSGIRADKESLDRILYHHHRFIPFDNLDIWAKAALPELSVPAVNDKLVRRKRGGYCFEMNGHLEAALRSLGFTCYGVEIRVVKGRDYMPPYLHRGVIASAGRSISVTSVWDSGFSRRAPRSTAATTGTGSRLSAPTASWRSGRKQTKAKSGFSGSKTLPPIRWIL